MIELRECPFCGSEVQFSHDIWGEPNGIWCGHGHMMVQFSRIKVERGETFGDTMKEMRAMIEYHVGCGVFGIYAGTLNKNGDKWRNKSDVTLEAMGAVAQHLLDCNTEFHFNENCQEGSKWFPEVDGVHLNASAWEILYAISVLEEAENEPLRIEVTHR